MEQNNTTKPPNPPKNRITWPTWAVVVAMAGAVGAGGLLGLAAGTAGDGDTGAAPEACIEAIDIADEIISINAKAFLATADAIDAISSNNYVAANRHMDDVDDATAQLNDIREDYHAAKDGCRGA